MLTKISSRKELSLGSDFAHLSQMVFFLKVFFYVNQMQREKIEALGYFLQPYKIKLNFLTKEKRFFLARYFKVKANFIAQSIQPIAQSDFICIINFLSLQVIVVSFSYGNQIWTFSRFLKWHKILAQTFLLFSNVQEPLSTIDVKRPHEDKRIIRSSLSQTVHRYQDFKLWIFFKQMIF